MTHEAHCLAELIFEKKLGAPTESNSYGQLLEATHYDAVPPTSNKTNKVEVRGEYFEVYDLTATNIPNRQFHGGDLSICRRRCQLIAGNRIALCFWRGPRVRNDQEELDWRDRLESWLDRFRRIKRLHPPDIPQDIYNWDATQQRWPHHCIPGFKFLLGRDTPLGYDQTKVDSASLFPVSIIDRIATNEVYGFKFAFRIEMERLQRSINGMLQNLRLSEIEDTYETLEILTNYLEFARESHSRLKRRTEIGAISDMLELESAYDKKKISETIIDLDSSIDAEHKNMLALTKLLPVIQNERSVRFRQYASSFAIVFSLATLIVSIYGMNVQEASLPVNSFTWVIFATGTAVAILLAIVGIPIKNGILKIWRKFQRER